MRKGDRAIPRPQKKKGNGDKMEYRGEVTVQIRNGDNVIKEVKSHNSGKLPLFEFIMLCITGNFYPDKRPANLMAFSNGMQALSSPIVTPAIVTWGKAESYCTATLTWAISFSYVKSEISSIDSLKIYSRENSRNNNALQTPSAEVNLEEPIDLTDGNNMLVAWKMTIGNVE